MVTTILTDRFSFWNCIAILKFRIMKLYAFIISVAVKLQRENFHQCTAIAEFHNPLLPTPPKLIKSKFFFRLKLFMKWCFGEFNMLCQVPPPPKDTFCLLLKQSVLYASWNCWTEPDQSIAYRPTCTFLTTDNPAQTLHAKWVLYDTGYSWSLPAQYRLTSFIHAQALPAFMPW